MNQQIQHVVALAADLQAGFDPIQLCGLEELRGLEFPEKILLRHRLWPSLVQLVQNETLQ